MDPEKRCHKCCLLSHKGLSNRHLHHIYSHNLESFQPHPHQSIVRKNANLMHARRFLLHCQPSANVLPTCPLCQRVSPECKEQTDQMLPLEFVPLHESNHCGQNQSPHPNLTMLRLCLSQAALSPHCLETRSERTCPAWSTNRSRMKHLDHHQLFHLRQGKHLSVDLLHLHQAHSVT